MEEKIKSYLEKDEKLKAYIKEKTERIMASNFMEDSAFKFITTVEGARGYPVASYILRTLGIEFDEIYNASIQEEYISLWAKRVNPDVTLRINGMIVTLDMQKKNEPDLLDRLLGYALSVAFSYSRQGERYQFLGHKTWVVFLCDGDLFGKGEVVYTFNMGGEKFAEYFEGFEIGIKVVNLEKAREEDGEIGVLARDLNNPDPHTMESDVFQYAAENYKIKNGGREKMREMVEDMESKKFLEIVEDVEKRSKAEGIREGEKKGREEGARKRSIEVAKTMLSTKRYSIEEVAEISSLSRAEVKKLAVSYN